ncbi:hypothetical protein Mmc1_1085 [Magnetococcus marinus MC-1]|uniref:Rubrerythrin n=1 Tax=Magnetococcus marinus (strain ATCC BAA-1437 / JCM 17883 / MC-1) TaxID=156889 RepID=A0L6L0_MAGMM|nr:ferritin family protein [Magnetococcus marinus]ABK43603.1 hypothetical protein Mmc1_1085 [Magnetococcus marinus MC-1]
MNDIIELWKAAIRHEALTVNFYSRAAEVTRDDASRMLFLQLAEMEGGHIQELLGQAAKASCLKESDVDLAAYAAGLEDNGRYAFNTEDEQAFLAGNMRTVLQLALGHELEAVKMYQQLALKTLDEATKQFCLTQQENEKRHVHELETLLNSLELTPEDRPGL